MWVVRAPQEKSDGEEGEGKMESEEGNETTEECNK
jgi:hypothetical protein